MPQSVFLFSFQRYTRPKCIGAFSGLSNSLSFEKGYPLVDKWFYQDSFLCSCAKNPPVKRSAPLAQWLEKPSAIFFSCDGYTIEASFLLLLL